MIAIVDYGMGNLASVAKAFEFLGGRVKVTSDPGAVCRSKGLILPGVGAFGEAMAELKKRNLMEPIKGSIRGSKPFLGLCLGLQLLFSSSEESPGVKGLSILAGRVRRLPRRAALKVPHIGWNQIQRVKQGALFRGVPEGAFMYFVHSFYADPKEKGVVAATTQYGLEFPSAIERGPNLWATQFHPEKSQRFGLTVLKNFLEMVNRC
ncbi:MAG: imidazole glycerol phosphate synthase subunit HisH [Candidatus Omnitrophica bacterium]|nr:imidazole glycerol phosphate synthase subunit HisH [Candidatus Omnitrophota bacterium]